MFLNLRKILTSFLLAAVLLPSVAFATTEFKGKETVNINRADAATLAAYLKGIGANKAAAIVKYRKSNGKFKTVDDLKNVPGIGDETVKDNKRKMSTSRGKSTAPEGYKIGKTSGKSKSSSKKSTAKKSSSSSKAKKTSSKSSKTSKSSSSSSSKKKASKTSTTKKKTASKTKTTKKPKTTKKKTTKKKTTKKPKKTKKVKKKTKKAKKKSS